MQIKRYIVVLAAIAFGCSSESDPVAVVEQEDDGYLARVYEQEYASQPYYLETSSKYVSLRFDPALSAEEIDAFLSKHGLRVRGDIDPTYRLRVVGVNNAFAEAAALAANPEITYLGPVFWRSCGTHFLLVGNQIIIHDEVTNASVDSLLQAESATLIEADTVHPNAIHYTYELPWGPAGHLFDLCLYLTKLDGVTYCEPNYVLPCD